MELENTIERGTGAPAETVGATKKVFVKTYGCQMNVYDLQRMTDALGADGYAGTDTIEDADLVLLNTCHIREKAAEKVYSELGRIRGVKAERPSDGFNTIVGVAGCVAQAEGREIIRREPAVDLVIGPQTYHRLPDALKKARGGEKIVETDYAIEDKFEHLPSARRAEIIGRGDDCVPDRAGGLRRVLHLLRRALYRRLEVSRPVAQIVAEAERLAEAGAREVTLLGENVTACTAKARRQGMGARPAAVHAGRNPRPCPAALHHQPSARHGQRPDRRASRLARADALPTSSRAEWLGPAAEGDEPLSTADVIAVIERIRTACAIIAMSADFIVGFPGEMEADFEATMQLVRTVGYAQAFSFKYSPRPGTPGAEMKDQVAETVKDERLQRLQALLMQQQRDFAAGLVGTTISALIEKPGRQAGQKVGRSPWLQPVILDETAGEIGDIIEVRMTRAGQTSLYAEPA